MKILWLTFTVFPEAFNIYSGSKEHRGSGGWLFSSATSLLKQPGDIEICVAMVSSCFTEFKFLCGERLLYYTIPSGKGFDKYHHGYDNYWQIIESEYRPDVVHVHGLESSIGLSYIRVCGNSNVVCSLQGLPNIIARYLMHGLTLKEMLKNTTVRDMARFNTYLSSVKANARKDTMVKEMMLECNNFIGRTEWDKTHLWTVNPNANYFFCNETLRSNFYNNIWQYEKCRPHTIFISAMKGLHIFLKALPIIVRQYPDTQVFVATGGNLVHDDIRSKLMMTGFEHMIKNRIRKFKIEKYIHFLGPLNEEQMVKHYLQANVFVCPSTCENSSNSVCEAQLLGVPLVASYVGGMADLIPNDSCGVMYRSEEYEMLSKKVCDIFEKSSSFDNREMRSVALKRHDAKINAERTIEIYTTIINTPNNKK